MDALAFAMQLLAALPSLIAAGKDVVDLINASNAVLANAQANGGDPTPAEWAALNGAIGELRSELHASE